MAAATKKQIQLIYVIAAKCGLVERGNKQDNLHCLVYQLTEKESISELTEEQAAAVISRLKNEEAAADEKAKAFISEAQIKKIFGLMYELAALSPSDAKVKDRLCGIIHKELGIKVNPRTDIFKGFSERQGAALIEALKRYIRQAKKKGKANGYKQA
ncbi:MAG: DUF1018 domain-containing protein [Ruminococcaceae bacterium]|nr:DUF1018 domain-containing protein [Oscillospiraceae bacterium]